MSKNVCCEVCGNENATITTELQSFEYQSRHKMAVLEAHVDVISCEECGLEYTGADAERSRHEAICRYLERFTPAEIREIRRTFSMTQSAFAEALGGLGVLTIKRWESGAAIPSVANNNAIKDLRHRLSLESGATAYVGFSPKFRTEMSPSILEAERQFELRPARKIA